MTLQTNVNIFSSENFTASHSGWCRGIVKGEDVDKVILQHLKKTRLELNRYHGHLSLVSISLHLPLVTFRVYGHDFHGPLVGGQPEPIMTQSPSWWKPLPSRQLSLVEQATKSKVTNQ